MSETNHQSQQNRATLDGATEDVPEYRSVMIQSSVSPGMKQSFLPLEKSSVSPLIVERNCIYSKAETAKTSPQSSPWEQTELPSLPIDYSLVRTNVYVRDSSAQVVADRICNELKASSITIDAKGCEEKVCITNMISVSVLPLYDQPN